MKEHPAHMFLPPQTYLSTESNDESKVQTFWEGHKILKKSPNFLTSNVAFSEYLNLNVSNNGIPSHDRE